MWKPSPRYAQTSISCSLCKKPLIVRRSCHHAYLSCEHCNKDFSIQDYIQDMDPVLEEFLEGISCDRI